MAFGDRQKIRARPCRVPTADTRAVKPPEKRKDPWLYTPAHRKWSEGVIARAGGMCQDPEHDPNTPRSGIRLFADHVIERRDNPALALDPRNGVARCGACHTRKTIAERVKRLATRFDVQA